MRQVSIVATLTVLMLRATIAAAQIPAEGLKAEGEHRWGDALALYEPVVRDHPERADLWVRISDIRAAMGDVPGSLAALYAAVNAAGSDGDLYARLSRAYAAANQPKAALAAIQGAVALRPSDPGLLKAQGDLAAWAGNVSLARESVTVRSSRSPGPIQQSGWHSRASKPGRAAPTRPSTPTENMRRRNPTISPPGSSGRARSHGVAMTPVPFTCWIAWRASSATRQRTGRSERAS